MSASKRAGVTSAPAKALTLHDHIKELRTRMLFVAIVFVIMSSVAYSYRDPLIHFLLQPLGGEKLVYLNPGGGFSFIFSVTMYVGVAFAVPILIYNLYRFVKPALPKTAQRGSALVLLASFLLLIAGVSFGYIYAIPGALNFLTGFAGDYISASLTADSYLSFVLAYTAGLGILFQLPLILLFVHWIHPLKPGGLLKFERFAVVIAFVLAAFITPTPDIVNQCIIATPIIIMYQIGFGAILVSISRQKRATKKRAAQDAQRLPVTPQDLSSDDDTLPIIMPPVAPRSLQTATMMRSDTPSRTTGKLIRPASRRIVSDIVRSTAVRLPAPSSAPLTNNLEQRATLSAIQPISEAQKPTRKYSVDGISFSTQE